MMKNVLLVVVVCFSCISVRAQIANYNYLGGAPLMTSKYDGVEGTPYFGGGLWVIGTAINSKGHRYENVPLRYNAYEDVLEVKQEGDVLIVERSDISSFEYFLSDETGRKGYYQFKTGTMLNIDNEKGYFRILFNSEHLKILEKVKIIQVKVTPAAYGQSDITKFVEKSESFIYTKNGLEKSKINQKALLEAFPSKRDLIKNFIKSNDINLSDIAELQKTCDYIITIL